MNTKLLLVPTVAVILAILSIEVDDSLEFLGLFCRLLTPSFVILFIAPLCYAKNKELRRHVKNLIWNQKTALVDIVP